VENNFDIAGHSVVVTGASRGIGFAIARHFLTHGASVIIGGVNADETADAVASLRADFGRGRVDGLAGDISSHDVAQALVALAYERFGRLDTVVGNAGIDIIKPATDYSVDEWDKILDVNLKGAFLPAQAAARRWIEQGAKGSVILTSSIAARAGVRGLAPYGASKGAIDQLIRNLAVEWAEHGIRVNAVAPGYVDNVMTGVVVHSDPATEERIRIFTPLRRRATVNEIAAPYVFLSSSAAAYITGAVLAVDGGYTAQ